MKFGPICRLNGELFLCDEVGVGLGLGIQDIIIRWYFSHNAENDDNYGIIITPNIDERTVLYFCNVVFNRDTLIKETNERSGPHKKSFFTNHLQG